jgi:hypothetical protein
MSRYLPVAVVAIAFGLGLLAVAWSGPQPPCDARGAIPWLMCEPPAAPW